MSALEFPAKLSEGRLPRTVAEQLAAALRQAWDKRVVITVKEVVGNRRPNKRKYYFAVVVRNVCLALRDAGNSIDEEETHVFLKGEVGKLNKYVVLPDGEVKYTLRSYRDLTPKEESDYLSACAAWCAEMGVDCPPPDPFHDTTNPKETTPCHQA